MNRAQAGTLLVVACFVVTPLVSTASAGAAAGAARPAAAPGGGAVEADTVEFRITVFENRSARWRFTYTRILDNETERQRFRSFAEEFRRNETAAYRDFKRLARGLAASGRNATGRTMEAVDFSKDAYLGGSCVTQDCGTVRMSFTWTGFAVRRGDRILMGDVFGTGLYLAPDQQLVITAGPELAFESVAPDTYNDPETPLVRRRSITYQGEMRFSDRRPRVVFVPREQVSTATTTGGGDGDGTSGDTGSPAAEGGGGFPAALVGVLLVVLVGVGAAFAWWRGGGAVPGAGGGSDGGAASEPVGGEPAVPDEELLTDEDRVMSLLEENGGRMKQVDIVDETGWSKSKVSMLLSEMEEEDQISKLRVGRENIISLSGHEPEAASSPHEEE